eukprot:TRINITY_DN54472_c0_g1_i1.p1 TRINITY_DN54472_c0_g1~~TRINITY_DN54472_c0_g1_i1.p1  ORF type:complete len:552 (-),score=44.11 TRINITY_DN54472_c0_g1_i1:508-2163(-)
MAPSARDFASTMVALQTLISAGDTLAANAARRRDTVHHMQHYVKRCGLEEPMKRMRFVHVAGSKGKGSTCILVNSLLRNYPQTAALKIGLYTSPHLVSVRERIRVNGEPISEAAFAAAFWSIWECLHKCAAGEHDIPPVPGYFKFLTLVALRAWEDAKVDIGVVEVGMGGRFDATNVICANSVVACGINTLELEHTRVLGNTLQQIAWEKGGILRKRDASFESPKWFTVPQNSEAMRSLEDCAEEGGGRIQVVQPFSSTQVKEVGLHGDEIAAGINAALALVLARTAALYFDRSDSVDAREAASLSCHCLTQEEVTALRRVSWPGRAQILAVPAFPKVEFCIDGAHTKASMSACVRWYDTLSEGDRKEQEVPGCLAGLRSQHCPKRNQRAHKPRSVLLFACGHEKSPLDLLRTLLVGNRHRFALVLFCTPDHGRPSNEVPPDVATILEREPRGNAARASAMIEDALPHHCDQGLAAWPRTLATVFAELYCAQQQDSEEAPPAIVALPTVADALARIAACNDKPTFVLATGSLYLAGNVLEKLGWMPAPAQA